ncbi:MAG TPA: nuclear transport factor 2 family protein [Steroidobacter sp.]
MLKRMLVIAVLPFCLYSTIARTADTADASPEEVVRAYTEAANRHDLEAFLALYASGIRKFRFPGELTSEGIEHNRAVYSKAFPAAPNLKIEILELFAVEDKVVVHDRVTGRPDGKTADEITVYQVQAGRITNIVYVEQKVRDGVQETR